MSPTVGSIWARATRIGSSAITAEVSPSRLAERAEAPARVQPMRDRRRHLVGFSVAALLLLAAAPAAASASVGLADGGAEPRLAEPEAVHRAEAAADRSAPAADRRPRPQPQRLHRARRRRSRPPARRTSASTGWPRASTPPTSPTRDGDGVPDFVEQVLKIAEHVHEVENDKLGWREPQERRPQGRRRRQDRHLPLPDRRRTVRLRRPRPRPGDQAAPRSRAACTATWSSTTTTAPSSSPAPSRSTTSR